MGIFKNISKAARAIPKIAKELKRIRKSLDDLLDILDPLSDVPNPVGPLTATLISEEDGMLIYDFTPLPQLADPSNPGDTANGLVRLSFDGVTQTPIETTIGQTTLTGVRIPQGAVVDASFVFVDDATPPNESLTPVVMPQFTANDTLPPSDPTGTLGAQLVGEE